MKTTLLMNFSVNKEKKQVHVEREFAGSLAKVWAAWTQKELLDQWWAPRPWQNKTKSMDFREGGTWLYSMVGPDGSEHFCRFDYKTVKASKSFSGLDSFCDSKGVVNTELPGGVWSNTFTQKGDSTVVDIVIGYPSIEVLEKIIEMGFKEGFTMGLEQLDELLLKK